MSAWDGFNRRDFPRVAYPCLVVIRNVQQDKDVILCHTENLSTHGISIILKQNINIGSEVDIELDLLDLGNHIKCKGKVCWSRQRKHDAKKKPLFYDMGIEFLNMEPEFLERLDVIVKRLVQNVGEVESK